jgi:hypothetical protein
MSNLKTLSINDTGYLKIASGTVEQRPQSPSIGMVRYNTDFQCTEYYNGIDWIDTETGTIATLRTGLVLNLDSGITRSYPGTGNTWFDLTGRSNNGTLANGTSYQYGNILSEIGDSDTNEGSIFFDGIDDYVTIPDITGVTDFSNTDNYTVDFWVYLNQTQNNTQNGDNDVVEKWSNSGSYPFTFRYVRSTQTMEVAVYNGTSSNIASIQISHSNWWHICGVFNWSKSLLTLYGNGGNITSSTTLNLTGTITNDSALNLMRRGNGINYATGRIGSLKIYNRALTESEIRLNYGLLKSRFEKQYSISTEGLVFYIDTTQTDSYPGTGTVWYDLGIAKSNGTLLNGPAYSSSDGGYISFDGSNDYADFGTFFTYASFTISIWVYPGSTQVQYADIFDNNHTGNRSFVLQQDNLSTNQYSFGVNDASGNISIVYLTLPPNYWTNITFTFTPSDRLKCYINGQFFNQGIAAGGRNVLYSSQSLRLAGWFAGGRNWNGRISNMMAYNRVLSAQEVQQNYNVMQSRYQQIQYNSAPIITNGLVLRLDASNPYSYSGTGTNWIDLSGNVNTATLNSVEIVNGYSIFNSSSDSISFATNIIIAREKTLSFWIKTDRPLSQDDNWEIGFLNQGTTPGSMFGMMFGVGPTQDLGYWGFDSAYDFSINNPSTKWIDLNTWVNVTCTMDSSRNVRVYKNGTEQLLYRNSDGATSTSFSMPIDTTNYFLINSRGAWNAGMTYVHLNGVLIYNRTLSSQEIQQNFNASRGIFGI